MANTSTVRTGAVRVLGYRVDAITVGYQAGLDDGTLEWLRAAHDHANGVVRVERARGGTVDDFDAAYDEDLRSVEAGLNRSGPGRVPVVPFSVGPFPFALDARLARSGAFILRNAECTMLVGLDECGWDVEIKWDAMAIATKGHAECFRLGRTIVDELRVMAPHPSTGFPTGRSRAPVRERLRRLDVCSDVEGFERTETSRWTMRAKKQGEYRVKSYLNGQEYVTGRTFGDGSAFMGRVYDKTLELQQQHAPDSEKTMTERAAWRAAGWSGVAPVTRVEFELKREALDSSVIDTPEDLSDGRLRELWAYLTTKWLRYNDGRATRNERCEVDPRWKVIQEVPFAAGSAAPLERVHGRKRGATPEQACGVVLSALAATGRLPTGSTEATVASDVSRAFEEMLRERFTPSHGLLAVEGYRASQAEITRATRVGERPKAGLPSALRETLRKRQASPCEDSTEPTAP